MSDLINRVDAVKEFIKLFGCIQDVSDIDEWEDVCQTTIHEISSAETTGALDDAIAKYVADGLMELPSAEAVQGEWTYLSGSKGSYMTISCPICGSTFDGVAEWKYNYCPNCGARMKGGGSE